MAVQLRLPAFRNLFWEGTTALQTVLITSHLFRCFRSASINQTRAFCIKTRYDLFPLHHNYLCFCLPSESVSSLGQVLSKIFPYCLLSTIGLSIKKKHWVNVCWIKIEWYELKGDKCLKRGVWAKESSLSLGDMGGFLKKLTSEGSSWWKEKNARGARNTRRKGTKMEKRRLFVSFLELLCESLCAVPRHKRCWE